MTSKPPWRPSHRDPLFILAMDHRGSFGSSLFDVQHDAPTAAQAARMRRAKDVIYAGLVSASQQLTVGRAGVLVDERYGRSVIQRATRDEMVLAVPIEASGHDWFTLEWGEQWMDHVREVDPDYAKVLVRDNPAFDPSERAPQLERLAGVGSALDQAGVPLIYELLVPGTPEQLAGVGQDTDRYDRDIRPELVAQVIAGNQAAGVEPTLWKVEGLDTPEAGRLVAEQARAQGRAADLIVLGRDAPADRLRRWLEIAAGIEAFVGFAVGRSIWESVVEEWVHEDVDDEAASGRIATTYLEFVGDWTRPA